MLHKKINTQPNSLAHNAGQIQAPNACDREKVGNRINSISAADLLHFTGQRAKIRIVFRFDRLFLYSFQEQVCQVIHTGRE